MIKRLKYNEIDFAKYTECLENSVQRKYSAEKIFLDITTQKQWEILVYKDYQAVMPIPFVMKMKIKFVHNPKLCQQLGIFSKEDSVVVNDLFLDFLKKNYVTRYYAFNDCNQFSENLITRKNFLILPEDYDIVYKRYSPKRKRKIRQEPETKQNSEIKVDLSFAETESFILKNMRGVDDNPNDYKDFFRILKSFYIENKLKLIGFYYHGKLINLIAVYENENTSVLIGTFNDAEFVKLSGASVLIDDYLKKNIQQKMFDFEGGEVANVEEFFRGFRPVLKPYPVFSKTKKEIIKKIVTPKIF